MDMPERSLEPPKDTRRVYKDCVECGEPVREFEDCVDLYFTGCVCMNCVKRFTKLEVCVDD